MIRDEVQYSGQVLVETINEAGEVIHTQRLKNKVVASGRVFLAQLLDAYHETAAHLRPMDMRWMALGSRNSDTTDDMTALGTEIRRVAIDARTRSGATVTFVAIFGTGWGGQMAELGIFNSPTSGAGTMLARVIANPAQMKDITATVRVTWTIYLNS